MGATVDNPLPWQVLIAVAGSDTAGNLAAGSLLTSNIWNADDSGGRDGMLADVSLVVPQTASAAAPAADAVRTHGMPAHPLWAARGSKVGFGLVAEVGNLRLFVPGGVWTETVDEAGVAALEGPVLLDAHCARYWSV